MKQYKSSDLLISFQYNMNNHFLDSLVSKVSCLRELYVEYKFFDPHSEVEDCTDFNKYVAMYANQLIKTNLLFIWQFLGY